VGGQKRKIQGIWNTSLITGNRKERKGRSNGEGYTWGNGEATGINALTGGKNLRFIEH